MRLQSYALKLKLIEEEIEMDNTTKLNMQAAIQSAEKVRPQMLIKMLDHYAEKIKVLSLDCFDTLLWRKAAAPKYVFYDLQHRPTFASLGFTATLRMSAEGKARQLMALKNDMKEIKLRDIYCAEFPELDEKTVTALEEEELAQEMQTCYAFTPMLELIREAHKRGIKVIIVSDIYFNETQIRRLLSNAIPHDVLAMVDKIFCSSDYATSKTSGLFQHVLRHLACPPEAVLHLGDNIAADYMMPRAFKMNAVHFVQHEEYIDDLLRLQDTAAKILDPAIGHTRSHVSPFRAVLGSHAFQQDKPETMIGYASLGPLMYSFASFIEAEVNELEKNGKKPKVVFLMRDAYLPSLAS